MVVNPAPGPRPARVMGGMMFVKARIRPIRALVVAGAAVLMLAMSGAVTAAGASQTATGSTLTAPAGCSLGALCFWQDINEANITHGELQGTNSSWYAFPHQACPSGTWANCASSIFNNGRHCTARVWYYAGFGGPHLDIPRGYGYHDLQNVPLGGGYYGSWDNNIEANSWVNCG
jgi:Peptidase inhibitor family I36